MQGLGGQVFVREFVPACLGQMLAAWECVERVGEDGRWVFRRPMLAGDLPEGPFLGCLA